MNLSKKDFIKYVMNPLSKEFGFTLVFNGREAREELGLELRGALGRSFTSRPDKPCVITWHRDIFETLQVLCHEIGHSAMHGRGSGFKGGKDIKEIEAENVAKFVFELMGMPYRTGFKNAPNLSYIGYFTKKYYDRCKRLNVEPKEPRMELIEQVAHRIVNTLKNVG